MYVTYWNILYFDNRSCRYLPAYSAAALSEWFLDLFMLVEYKLQFPFAVVLLKRNLLRK